MKLLSQFYILNNQNNQGFFTCPESGFAIHEHIYTNKNNTAPRIHTNFNLIILNFLNKLAHLDRIEQPTRDLESLVLPLN